MINNPTASVALQITSIMHTNFVPLIDDFHLIKYSIKTSFMSYNTLYSTVCNTVYLVVSLNLINNPRTIWFPSYNL